MNGIGWFAACFILVSAATALVNSAIQLHQPWKIAREAIRFFLMIVLGILAFSGIVYLLEWTFIPR